jgi:hypothetical protein
MIAYTSEQVEDRSSLGWIAQDIGKLFSSTLSTSFKPAPDHLINFRQPDPKNLSRDLLDHPSSMNGAGQ